MKHTKIFFIAALLITTVACDNEESSPNLTAELDKNFMLSAFDCGLFEINAGQVASAKGTTDAIKGFGAEMLKEHNDINQELMEVAKAANVNLPTTLSNEKQQKLDSLSALSKMAFDTTYIKMMGVSHEEAVSLYEIQATTARNEQLKTFASDKLPRLRAHLGKAKSLNDSIQ